MPSPRPTRTLQPKDLNLWGLWTVSNKLSKARKDHFSATMRMFVKKRDFKIYRVQIMDFTADFEGIIIVFDTWLFAPILIVNKLFILLSFSFLYYEMGYSYPPD